MAIYDKAKNWWDSIDTGMNVFGAGMSTNDKLMQDAGLLKKEDIKRAKEKSIVQGLLTAGLSYAMQPKNKGYGSAVPYVAQALKAGMVGAQTPFDKLQGNAEMREKIKAYKLAEQLKLDKKNLFTTIPQTSSTINIPSSIQQDSPLMSPDGQTQLEPSFATTPQTTTTPEITGLDLNALSKFSIQHPEAAKSIWDNQKIQAEIGILQNPESFRAATTEEVLAMGGDPTKGGQINTKTGKFFQSGGTVINTGDQTATTINDSINGFYNEIFSNSRQAKQDYGNYSVALRLLPTIGETGVGTEGFRNFDKVLIAFGMEPKNYTPEQIASGEIFESIGNKLAIAQRPAASGVMTDNDFLVFKSMVNSLGKSKEANMKILKLLQLVSDRNAGFAKKSLQYRRSMTSKLTDINGEFEAKKVGDLDEGLYFLQEEYADETNKLMMQMFPEQYGEDGNPLILNPNISSIKKVG